MPDEIEVTRDADKRRRRLLKLTLAVLLLLCAMVVAIALRYINHPQPLPDLVPGAGHVYLRPHHLFAITGVDKPVGVAVSADGKRVYVAESDGERLIKCFGSDGKLITKFQIPNTFVGERAPVYLAVDSSGRVFVTDRTQGAIYVFTQDGQMLDAIITPTMTLTEYVARHAGGLPAGTLFGINYIAKQVRYTLPGQAEQILPLPNVEWSPLGLRFDRDGNLWVTDVLADNNRVHMIPRDVFTASSWLDFNPQTLDQVFGGSGVQEGQLSYPNVAMPDTRGRVYVSDGNNGRISVWNTGGQYQFQMGKGVGDGALALPRGIWLDGKNRLYIADAVEHDVKVFDVSGDEPTFLTTFGSFGVQSNNFNYPMDIALDDNGRIYVADRENNRVQVWSN